ncbi:MAG: phosphatase PAP2 family protein [Cryobacterium sp.]
MDDSQKHPEGAASQPAQRVAHWWPVVSGIVAVVLAVLIGFIVVVRDSGAPFAFDTAWMLEIAAERAPVWDFLSYLMNALGGNLLGILVVPVLIIAVLLLMKRPWAAGYYLAATLASSGMVQLLKKSFGRARPEDILVQVDFGSFPSGHVGNAATMAVVFAILFPRVWVWLAGVAYVVLMMISRTYLGAHWLSDTIGGALLGIGVAIVIWAPFAAKLDGERKLTARRRLATHPPGPKPSHPSHPSLASPSPASPPPSPPAPAEIDGETPN